MTRKQKRLSIIAGGVGFITAAVLLVMFALQEEIVFFRSPTDIAAEPVDPATRIRLGGLVAEGSLVRGEGRRVRFAVTDHANTIDVTYEGILPDLFREGQGVIAEGRFSNGSNSFVADTILARHDENYMPKEVADALKEQGEWYGETDIEASRPATGGGG